MSSILNLQSLLAGKKQFARRSLTHLKSIFVNGHSGTLYLFLSIGIIVISAETSTAQVFANNIGGYIPDSNTELLFPVVVSGLGVTIDASFGLKQCSFNITHTYDGDLMIKLKSPDGTVIILCGNHGESGDDFTNTIVSENATDGPIANASAPFNGNYYPDESLDILNNGQNPNGTWYMCITDVAGEDAGALLNFNITFGTPGVCNGWTVYADADGDGYGNVNDSLFVADCIAPNGYVYDKNDCNDDPANGGASIHPYACDIINGNNVDDNCDGIIDNGFGTTLYYTDADDDGYGTGTGISLCNNPGAGYSTTGTDCDDDNAYVNPGSKEIINGIDDNCDGTIDSVFWIQKTNFAGANRFGAVGFSIGNKGYIVTGKSGDYPYYTYHKDFWEYDPVYNTWTQKANFAGTGREGAVAFSVGGKGYIGTGYMPSNYYNNEQDDFWEYDPITNTWEQKAQFGGTARGFAAGFSIGSKGYIGTGGYNNDFWEYDPATDAWSQKANFGGTSRGYAVGFSIGSKGYIGTGWENIVPYDHKNDFWEYDPSTNTWTQKADFEGTARYGATGFSIGNKGYIGTGFNNIYPYAYNDFWEYDPAANAWTQKTDFGGTARGYAAGFSIAGKGYIGTGWDSHYTNDFWEYNPDGSSCALPANLSVTKITSSSAKLNWDAVAGAEGYAVRYKISNTNGWKYGTTQNISKPISGLSPNRVYKWEVRTYCEIASPYATSGWSSKQEFTTAPLRVSDESFQQVSFQIYPNPAEDHATLQFILPQSSHICIKVYDVSGKEIATLLDEVVEQGNHSLLINTNHFPKGIYLVKMISDPGTVHGTPLGEIQKLIVQ